MTYLKDIRKAQQMTAEELSIKSGVNRASISSIENGSESIGEERAQKIADALSISPDVMTVYRGLIPDYARLIHKLFPDVFEEKMKEVVIKEVISSALTGQNKFVQIIENNSDFIECLDRLNIAICCSCTRIKGKSEVRDLLCKFCKKTMGEELLSEGSFTISFSIKSLIKIISIGQKINQHQINFDTSTYSCTHLEKALSAQLQKISSGYCSSCQDIFNLKYFTNQDDPFSTDSLCDKCLKKSQKTTHEPNPSYKKIISKFFTKDDLSLKTNEELHQILETFTNKKEKELIEREIAYREFLAKKESKKTEKISQVANVDFGKTGAVRSQEKDIHPLRDEILK